MRKAAYINLFLALLLCLAPLCIAQTPMNCDQLRSKIEHLEQMNPNTMSPTLQQTYREELLKLYLQLSQCEQDELAVLTEMRNTVAGTTAAASVEDRFQALSKEKTDTD